MKRIFTFWAPPTNIPGYIQLCMETWTKYLPDYEITVCNYGNLADYIGSSRLKVLLRKQLPLAMLADAVRTCLLEEHGGIWLDADTIIYSSAFLKEAEKAPMCMVGSAKRTYTHVAFIYAKEAHNPLIEAWMKRQLMRLRLRNLPAGHALLYAITRMRSLQKLLHTNVKWGWDFLSNSIIDPILRESSEDELQIIDSAKVFPEACLVNNGTTREQAYREYYFTKERSGIPFDLSDLGIVMLHNSWTPELYKRMSKEDFLQQDIPLAHLLRQLLV